jgi:hypothetical protein
VGGGCLLHMPRHLAFWVLAGMAKPTGSHQDLEGQVTAPQQSEALGLCLQRSHFLLISKEGRSARHWAGPPCMSTGFSLCEAHLCFYSHVW